MTEYAIKVRKQGEKRWLFLGCGGTMNHLRVHALRFQTKERAFETIEQNAPNNPDYDWKAVVLK